MSDFMQLFPTKARTDVITLSCAHVIPKENLLTQVINLGPSRKEMEFKYDTRNDESLVGGWDQHCAHILKHCSEKQIVELGALISSVINLIPDGVVVFLPSYAILAKVKEVWQRKGLIDKLDARKKVWLETTKQ
jgi:chromosome transmission fidelity protein 1